MRALQTGFRKTLLHEVKTFVTDAVAFQQEWEANGPTVPGLDPMDASDRLRKFQHLFEVIHFLFQRINVGLFMCASYSRCAGLTVHPFKISCTEVKNKC